MFVRKNIFQWLVLLLCFVVILGCSSSTSTKEQPARPKKSNNIDKLLEQAFAAIKSRDRAAYQALTITSADFVLKRMRIPKLKEKQGYVGSSAKPTELYQQYEQFNRAKNIEEEFKEDMIYFDEDTYVSAGKIVDHGVMPALNDVQIPYKTYTIKVKSGAGEVMDDLYPYFVIVQWGNQPRILKLLFPEAENLK
jgi:hypothetical protein